MTRKPATLSNAMAQKAARAAQPARPEQPATDVRILTLRLPVPTHEQLRLMAFEQRRSQHQCLMEALNDWFEKNGKPPIAPHAA